MKVVGNKYIMNRLYKVTIGTAATLLSLRILLEQHQRVLALGFAGLYVTFMVITVLAIRKRLRAMQ